MYDSSERVYLRFIGRQMFGLYRSLLGSGKDGGDGWILLSAWC